MIPLGPDFERHPWATPIEVSQPLPRTNCKFCDEPLCLAFVLKLVTGQMNPQNCPPIRKLACTEQLTISRERLGNMPAPG